MEKFIFITSLAILGMLSILAWIFPIVFINVLKKSQKVKRKLLSGFPRPILNYMTMYGESRAYIWLMRIVLLIAIAGVFFWHSL